MIHPERFQAMRPTVVDFLILQPDQAVTLKKLGKTRDNKYSAVKITKRNINDSTEIGYSLIVSRANFERAKHWFLSESDRSELSFRTLYEIGRGLNNIAAGFRSSLPSEPIV
jgi:hypothetical protein